MALLHILAALGDEFSLTLVAAYIDHGLRPDENPGEWVCVEEAANRLGLAAGRVAVDVRLMATLKKISPEHAARESRYQALASLAQQWSTDLLAVAHTADDQAEEVLLRLFRGGGRKALSGMRARSGTLIRPLLNVCKADLLAYLADKGVAFCSDSSNNDLRFLRNRIRHELLPLLEERYDPGIRQALLKTAANLSEDEDLLEHLLDQHWSEVVDIAWHDGSPGLAGLLKRIPFVALHSALQRRIAEKMLWQMGASSRYEHILSVVGAACTGRNGSELHLSRGLRVLVTPTHLEFSYPLGKGPWRGRL